MPSQPPLADISPLRDPRRALILGLALLGLTGLPGCHHVGDLFFPPLPGSDARGGSRVELRMLTASEIEARNRSVDRVLRSLTVKPDTIRELADKLATDRESGVEPSEDDRLRLHRTYAELDKVQRSLRAIDHETLAFRPRGDSEEHAAYNRARSNFYACTGLTDPYTSHPALDAFSPVSTSASTPSMAPPQLEANGLLLGASRYTASHGALVNGDLYRRSRRGREQIRQELRLLELRRSFVRGGVEDLALRLLYRVDFDDSQQLFRLSPVYLWLDETSVKVGGLQTRKARGAWGWLWPWMWGHAIWGSFDEDLYSVEIEAQIEVDAIVSEKADERQARRLGAARFQLGRFHAKHLPFERSCRENTDGLRSLPSPSLPIPPTTTDAMTLPIDVRASLGERNRFGHALASVGGLFSRDHAKLSPELPLDLGFAPPRPLTSDPAPPPPADSDRP
jgi:hypothetical protein